MHITEGQLRRIIREELINEVPFAGDAPLTPFPQHRKQPRPDNSPTYSVGYKDADKNRPEAIKLFSGTSDNWDIIPVENVRNLEELVEDEDFKAEIISRHYPPGTKILIVATKPYEGDYTETKWAIRHDIIGHTIDKAVSEDKFGTAYRVEGYREDLKTYADPEEISYFTDNHAYDEKKSAEYAIWRAMPEENQLGGDGDVLADIYAAIFFGDIAARDVTVPVRRYLTKYFPSIRPEHANEIAIRYGEDLMSKVEAWKDSMKPGVNIINLW